MADPNELVIVICEAGVLRCETFAAAPPDRAEAVRAKLDEARALLEPVGLWSVAPVIMLDAQLGDAIALTVVDAASEGLTAHAGQPAILFAEIRQEGEADPTNKNTGAETSLDVLLHELTHVWMRTRGANDTRWRLEGGRATHESAMVHEGLADFVAAALTNDPVLLEDLHVSHSIRAVARCPDGLTGQPHADSLIVSNTLWELGGAGETPAAMADVLSAVTRSAVTGSSGLDALVASMTHQLTNHPTLAARWEHLVADRGLRRCREPLEIHPKSEAGPANANHEGRVSARAGNFLAAGTQRFGVDEVTGPLHFTASVSGAKSIRITGRSSQPDALTIAWKALDARGDVLEQGRAPLEGWPSQFATLHVPPSSHTLTFGFSTSQVHDITFNNVGVSLLETYPAFATTPSSPPTTGCGCMTSSPIDLVAPLLVAWLVRARPLRP